MSDVTTGIDQANDAHIAVEEAHAGEPHNQAAGLADAHDAHAAAPDTYMMPHEIPNVATLIEAYITGMPSHVPDQRPHPSAYIKGIIPITPLFSILYAVILVFFIRKAFKHANVMRPEKLQNFFELIMDGLRKYFTEIMGPQGAKYVPFIGTLWLFIWMNNIAVLIPGLKSPSSSFRTTIALGLCTFCYVHYSTIRAGGIKAWFMHLLGEPLWMAPLNFPLHIVGELVKPLSLSLRLFGNIFGEDKLLASFLGIGMMLTAAMMDTPHPLIGIPFHMPFFFLVVLLSTVQATVFSLLASIYIVLLLPHEDHHEETDKTGGNLSESDDGQTAPAVPLTVD